MTTPTPIYLAIMVEVERRRMQVGISMDRISELAGNAERSYAKALYPDTSSGRCATWPTLQRIFDVLYCEGFELRLAPRSGTALSTEGAQQRIRAEAAHWTAPAMRQRMAELGRLSGVARQSKVPPSRRKEIATRAARARWRCAERVEHSGGMVA
jgi:hypothetical protein